MGFGEIFVRLVEALAWPVTIGLLVNWFWPQIAEALSALEEFRFGSASAKFKRDVSTVADKAETLVEGDRSPVDSLPTDFDSIAAQRNSTGTIMEIWKDVENAAKERLWRVKPGARTQGPSHLVAQLSLNRCITAEQEEVLLGLIKLRNQVAHRRMNVSYGEVMQYAEAAASVIKSLTESTVPAPNVVSS